LAPPAQRDLVLAGNGLNFENSDNVTHVLVSGFTGSNGQDLDTNDDGVLDVTPWIAVVDVVGLVEEPNPPTNTVYVYGKALGGENVGPEMTPTGNFVPGHVYRCVPAGDWVIGLFNPSGGNDTAGVANLPCPAPVCPGDRNNSGTVDVSDLLIIISTWGSNDPAGDANGSGIVDVTDLLIVIAGWGPCPR